MGRSLITLLLCSENAMAKPLLFLSLHFKQHRQVYYELLQSVRHDGDWEAWVKFFLEGVEIMSDQGTETARRVLDLVQVDHTRILELRGGASSIIRVHELLQRRPLLSIPSAAKTLGLSQPTVAASFSRLIEMGVVDELTGKARNRRFRYKTYLDLLAVGTEPLPAPRQ